MRQPSLLEDGQLEPLASRMRPRDLSEFVGQEDLVGKGRPLRRMIETDSVSSMILFGPPGVGKTTLANVIANLTRAKFINFSAVTSGIKEIKEIMARSEESRVLGERTVLFVDEIHRFNKAQQDAFLPYVEQGSITLIGATTENPSFEVNSALLSRCQVFLLKALDVCDLSALMKRALKSERGFGSLDIQYDEQALEKIALFSNGDARKALGCLETVVSNLAADGSGRYRIDASSVKGILGKKAFIYDKKGEEHYNLISALHKSMRNSDPDAAIYWLARMLEAGEDPLYIARRCVRFASEDVGLADSNALLLAVTVWNACNNLGMPECNVHLTQIVTYLSLAPKSNAMEVAYFAAADDAREMMAESVPMHIRNAPTKLLKNLGYSNGYQYAHDTADKITKMSCLPASLKDRRYYNPAGMGAELKLKSRAEAIRNWRAGITDKNPFIV